MVAGAFCFAVMGLGVKLSSQALGDATVVFFRNAISLAILLPWVARRGPRHLATRHPGQHLVRGLAGLASMYCFFYALARMRLADAVLLNYSTPLFTPLIAWLWLHEAAPRGLWRALGVGFLGIALVLKPGAGIFDPMALLAVASAGFAALAQVGVRKLTASEPVTRIVFYFTLISTLLSALPLPWLGRSPGPEAWAVLAMMGAAGTLGQLCMTWAYSQAPAAQVVPFIYASVPSAALLDGLVLGRWPDAASIAGALLIAVAGILTLRAGGAG